MAYSFLTPETIVETYRTSKQYTEGLTDNFLEYERIARNKPHGSIPKEYPKTTDGTTASIIRKTPHRIIQQLPTGKVLSDTHDWLSVVAEFVYTNKIIPYANEDYALLQKCWNVVERFLTFGFCPTYAPFVEHSGYFCPDLRLPYWGDIFIQPGKLSDQNSNYIFMRSWWQTKDIDALIESQSKLGKDVTPTWDVEALKKVKDLVMTKDEKAKTPIEREKNINTKGGIELITGFQRGVGAKFYTFHVNNTGKDSFEGTIVRTKANKDPRGELPVSFAYGDIDGSNPFGRGIIDLVGALQNLMDGEMQMYQYNRALQLNPPLVKRGNFNKNKIKFAPNTIIDMGSGGPDVNSIEPLKIDSTALANFPNNYGLMQSQLFQLLSAPNATISAEVGNVGFSKTPQGVEQNKANLSIDDNYVRKQFETWYERWSETAINIYFAERTGIEELQLDEEAADKLRMLADQGRFDLGKLSDDNKIRIDYDAATEKLQFRVDPSTSKKQDDAEQLAIIQEAMKQVTPQVSYYMSQAGWKFNLGEAYRTLLSKMGIENIDKLVIRMSPQEIEEAKKAPFPIIDPPQIRLTGQIPPGAMTGALSNGGINVTPDQTANDQPVDLGDILKDPLTPASVRAQIQQMAGLEPDQAAAEALAAQQNAANAPQPDAQPAITPEHVIQVHQQAHQQEMDKANLLLEAEKIKQQAKQAAQKPKQPAGGTNGNR